jgi:hypothetical protein
LRHGPLGKGKLFQAEAAQFECLHESTLAHDRHPPNPR